MSFVFEAVQLSTFLQRLAFHLERLAEDVESIEQTTGDLVHKLAEPESVPLVKLQSLDFTRQSVEDCALLLRHLSKAQEMQHTHISGHEEFSKYLKLASTKKLLDAEGSVNATVASGEFDAF